MSTPPPTPRSAVPRRRWVLAVLLLAVAAAPVALRYLVFWPLDQWQVDVDVYRSAGVSVLTGRPVYAHLTEPPQLLPFTYPPFAAFLAVPLAMLPFGVVGWLWTAAQVVATTLTVRYAGWGMLRHAGPWLPLALAAVAAPMLWLHPVGDGIRFGQVNAFIVLAVVLDMVAPRPRFLRHVPRGVLIGLAMAVKLTPGVFLVHFLVTRRWREAGTVVASAATVTLLSAALLPSASWDFWLGALQDSDRLGPNAGTANQSMRGLLLRVGLDGGVGTAVWLLAVAVVGVLGYALARRTYLRGDPVGEVAVVGLLACLLSPVAWVHHYHWVVVVVLALLGARPWVDRRRAVAGLAVLVFFVLRLPWWGIDWLAQPWPEWPGRVLQNADVVGGLASLVLLWWVSRRPVDEVGPTGSGTGAAATDTAADAPVRQGSARLP
ncbi:DUF2029 domain-containing protein [Phycicoccus sp. BSK3Z-2]|uniref:DUF2029 domain-containing protein n=1 Tax=Phycicoccus avicenniae TaxID=2828860 RepID=A0A941DDD6_9MICO|nr:glycosyltransferase 87 family protein [Phycicoccus avicenniae]MBR7744267.1 DUF2029 domain-containing protein [Phycicoccus avicenniae]